LTDTIISQFEYLAKIKSFPYTVEPDASSASYFQAAGWLLAVSFSDARETIRVNGDTETGVVQIDKMFLNFFRWARHIGWYDSQTKQSKASKISRSKELGDSIMTAIVMVPFADREIQFADLGRLRVQECERVVALRTELTKCGAKVTEAGDTLTVYPSKLEDLHGAEIETYNDHRMAMCFAILGLKVPGIKIKNPACVKKTFPNFFQKLAAPPPHGLGATILDAKTGRKLTHEDLFAE